MVIFLRQNIDSHLVTKDLALLKPPEKWMYKSGVCGVCSPQATKPILLLLLPPVQRGNERGSVTGSSRRKKGSNGNGNGKCGNESGREQMNTSVVSCFVHYIDDVDIPVIQEAELWALYFEMFHGCMCIRWTRAARPARESRLSALPFTLIEDTGSSGSAAAKHFPGQECHHITNVCLNLLLSLRRCV